MTTATPTTPRNVERRFRHAIGLIATDAVDEEGKRVTVYTTVERGQLVTVSRTEEARLDSLGALAPRGQTAEELDAEERARLAAFREARKSTSDPAGEAF